jgi:hypothetical protein
MTDLRFFREALLRRASDAVGYLAVLLILTWVIPFSLEFFIAARNLNDAVVSGIRRNIPADTTFTMKDGVFTNDLADPIVIEANGLRFIINSATSSLALADDEIGIAVNRDAIVQREGADRIRIIGYSDFPDFEIDRAEVDGRIAAYGPWVILLVSTVALFVFSLSLAVGFGLYVLLHGFILSVVLRLAKRPIRYSRAFTVAAYAATLPIVIKAVADWSRTDIGSIPTFLYWLILAFIVYDFRKEGTHGHEAAKPKEADRAPEGGSGRG